MNHLLGASIAGGRVAVGVATGIKCKPYLDSPLMRMVKLFTARSFINGKVGKNMTKENTGHSQTQKNFPRSFTNEGNAQMKTGYQQQIQFDDEGDQWIDSDEEDCSDQVKKRALDNLGTLDWESLQNHIIYFPRKRSDAEMRLIFEKWAAHYDRKYPSAELKEMRFATFKKRLSIIDKGNLKGEFTSVVKADSDIQG